MVGYVNNVEEGVVPETVHGMLFSIVLAAFPTSPNLTFQVIKASSVREAGNARRVLNLTQDSR